jgi:hypothetical protein
MGECINIVNQITTKLTKYNKPFTNIKYNNVDPNNILNYLLLNNLNKENNKNSYNTMETLIEHFKF